MDRGRFAPFGGGFLGCVWSDEINVLLDRPFTPSDVYREVLLAIKYSANE